MIKCKNCGSNLEMDENYCSYCGSINPHFVKQREVMEEYKEDYEETKVKIISKGKTMNSISVKIAVVCILLTLHVIVIALTMNSYQIYRVYEKMMINTNSDTHYAILEEYETDQDYIGFSAYYYSNDLYYNDACESFDAVYSSVSAYATIYSEVFSLLSSDLSQDSIESKISNIAWYATYMNRLTIVDDYSDKEQYSSEHIATMEDVKSKTFIILQSAFDLNDITQEEFYELSETSKQLYLLERIYTNETNEE